MNCPECGAYTSDGGICLACEDKLMEELEKRLRGENDDEE